MLEIEGDRVILTSRSGEVEELSVQDSPEDSYHPSWFGKVADELTRSIASEAEPNNLEEARTALALIEASRESARLGGASVALP